MPKTSNGCWTCRLRHKKCDELHPVCGGCRALEIGCHYGPSKPEWMDGGKRQRDMVQRIKNEVKRGAERRRGRRILQSVPRDVVDEFRTSTLHDDDQSNPSSEADGSPFTFSESRSKATSSTGKITLEDHQRAASSIATTPSNALDGQWPPVAFQSEIELSLMMAYLDYVFPILFPFYRPSLFEGGRSWVLVRGLKHEALFHTITSLTSFFFSVVPVSPGPKHRLCSSHTWKQVQTQIDLAVKVVQRDLHELNAKGVEDDLLSSTHLLESIVHLLSLEVVVSSTGNWKMHHDAAIVLFEQIFQHHGTSGESPASNMFAILCKMALPFPTGKPTDDPLWNASQAAFRFFSAVLLFDDIIASTSLEQPAKLRGYYDGLLYNHEPDGMPLLKLEEFIGCQNWVLLEINEIAELAAWKKEEKRAGTLNNMGLYRRASAIGSSLNEGLERLDGPNSTQPPTVPPTFITDILAESQVDSRRPCRPLTTATTTHIWAYAARTYLYTVFKKWQPRIDDVLRDDIAQALDLFKELPAAGWLRTLAWPFCVLGCLATEEQEPAFRDLVTSMEGLEAFGTMRVALNIMENAWRNRDEMDAEWDLASCLGSLGHQVLLV
ncbi:Fc.00g107130.m01.CDS01 [Cosmosporella sp. VM-42]